MPVVSNDRCFRFQEHKTVEVQETIEILQLQYTDKVIDVPVVPVQFPSAGVEKTAEPPTLQSSSCCDDRCSSRIRSLTCPLACNDRCISCSSWTKLTCQLLCNAKCAVSPACRRHPVVAQMQIPMVPLRVSPHAVH